MTISRLGITLAAAVFLATGCSKLPSETRTGKVYDIVISDSEVTPRDVVIGIGDEIRFRNDGSKPAYVFFFKDFVDELSCMRGFKFFWGSEEEAEIRHRESASLCFHRPGTVAYRVQWEPTGMGGGGGGTPGMVEIQKAIHGAIVVK